MTYTAVVLLIIFSISRINAKVVGGIEAEVSEFPHMALLGFVNKDGTTTWDCGGTIISNRWIMTAAHCTWKPDAGNVSQVLLGETKIGEIPWASNLFYVETTVIHPDYTGRQVYNDIALLKLTKKILFNYAKTPACLHSDIAPIDDFKVTAIGFGLTEAGNYESRSKQLMKVDLEKFTYEDCAKLISTGRRFPDGIKNATQICFGSNNDNKDTCQGDSGSPVQVTNNYGGSCGYAYTVLALTSFGASCGIKGKPAVYTRISHFVPWMKTVEPNIRIRNF